MGYCAGPTEKTVRCAAHPYITCEIKKNTSRLAAVVVSLLVFTYMWVL